MKFEVRKFSQTFAKKKAVNKRRYLKSLEDKVKALRLNLAITLLRRIRRLGMRQKKELENEYNNITQGIIIRSRAEWVEKSEKSNKYFLSLEKANKIKSTINSVVKTNGEVSENQDDIMKEIKSFYSNLFSEKQVMLDAVEANKFFNHEKIPQLNDEQKKMCDGVLTVDECFEVLNTFKKNKSPGNDGLTAEFYKSFWHLFGKILVASLNKSYQIGEISNSQKQGVIN